MRSGRTSTMTHKCPYCLANLELLDGVFPYHDQPKPCRRVCTGAQKTPDQALSEFKEWMAAVARSLYDLDTAALDATPGITVMDVPFAVGEEDE